MTLLSSLFSFDVNNKGGKDSNFHNHFDAEIECLNITSDDYESEIKTRSDLRESVMLSFRDELFKEFDVTGNLKALELFDTIVSGSSENWNISQFYYEFKKYVKLIK